MSLAQQLSAGIGLLTENAARYFSQSGRIEEDRQRMLSEADAKKLELQEQVDGFIAKSTSIGRTTAANGNDPETDIVLWDRVFSIRRRIGAEVCINTTGGWFSPGYICLHVFTDSVGNFSAQVIAAQGTQYLHKVRMSCDNQATPTDDRINIEFEMLARRNQTHEVKVRPLNNYEYAAIEFENVAPAADIEFTSPEIVL